MGSSALDWISMNSNGQAWIGADWRGLEWIGVCFSNPDVLVARTIVVPRKFAFGYSLHKSSCFFCFLSPYFMNRVVY